MSQKSSLPCLTGAEAGQCERKTNIGPIVLDHHFYASGDWQVGRLAIQNFLNFKAPLR